MRISIVTVVYNNEMGIAECIRSVLDQTYPDIEHIVIDGGSTDGTQQQIEPFREGLAYYISERDRGLYDALNKGIQQATGDIIGILHSDDLFYEPDTLQKVVDAFESPGVDLVYAKGQYIGMENSKVIKRIYPASPYHKWYLYFGWVPLHTTIFVRRQVYEKYGLYDLNYPIASDYEITLRWFTNDRIKKQYLDEWVVKMLFGGRSTSVKLQKQKSCEDLAVIHRYNLWGVLTLASKIIRKIPQYILPRLRSVR